MSLACAAAGARPATAIIINGTGDGAGQGTTNSWDGVGIVSNVNPTATGVLVDSTHVLLAAHEVFGVALANLHFTVGGVTYDPQSVAIHPSYTGTEQFDIAVMKLKTAATGVPTWAYNTGTLNEATAGAVTLVGYGVGGNGVNGADPAQPGAFPFGTRRAATNLIDLITTAPNTLVTDAYGQSANLPPGLLAYDFDNNTTQTGGPLGGGAIGANEGTITSGDSGGPMFQFDTARGQYVITGISIDSTDATDRFGEIAWGTRVSTYAPFLATAIPEPTSLALAALASAALLRRRRRF